MAGRRAAEISATAFWPQWLTITSAEQSNGHGSSTQVPAIRSRMTQSHSGLAARAVRTAGPRLVPPVPFSTTTRRLIT